jgi:hypothetical protein
MWVFATVDHRDGKTKRRRGKNTSNDSKSHNGPPKVEHERSSTRGGRYNIAARDRLA